LPRLETIPAPVITARRTIGAGASR